VKNWSGEEGGFPFVIREFNFEVQLMQNRER